MKKSSQSIFTKIKKYSRIFNKTAVKIQTSILLTLIFFLIITPLSTMQKLLKKKSFKKQSFWQKIQQSNPELQDFYKQY